MKWLPLLFAASLVANASLVVLSLRHGVVGGGGARGEIRKSGGDKLGEEAAETARFLKPEGPATGESKAIAAPLQGGDLDRLRDELRAAGVEEDLVRSIVSARLWKKYEARFKALQPQPDPDKPWWKNDEDGNWGGRTREQREEMRALQAEQKAEIERLLGEDPRSEQRSPWLARQYGFVSAEKREDLQQLESDYNELMQEMRREARGFNLPSDQEKLRFLAEEKRRDLAALLTPEEMEAYELRQSRTAQNLRWRATQMDAIEAEFRALFEIQREFDERHSDHDEFGNRVRGLSDEDRTARQEAEKAMRQRIRDTLGPERYAAYLRAQDNDYTNSSATRPGAWSCHPTRPTASTPCATRCRARPRASPTTPPSRPSRNGRP